MTNKSIKKYTKYIESQLDTGNTYEDLLYEADCELMINKTNMKIIERKGYPKSIHDRYQDKSAALKEYKTFVYDHRETNAPIHVVDAELIK